MIMPSNETLDDLVEQAVKAPTGNERRNIAAKARKVVIQKQPKKQPQGRPTAFNQKIADQILSRIANGETLTKIATGLNIPIQNIYNWMDDHQGFLENYRRSREQQAITLVDRLIEETDGLENDRALAVRVRADVIRWVAQRYAPQQFSDSKRIELSGEVRHKLVHELDPNQKRKIAESWMLSQQGDGLLIEGETVPELEAGVQTVAEEEERRVIPKKKRAALPAKIKQADPDDGGRWKKRGRE